LVSETPGVPEPFEDRRDLVGATDGVGVNARTHRKLECKASTGDVCTFTPTVGQVHRLTATYDGITLRWFRDGNMVSERALARRATGTVEVITLGRNYPGDIVAVQLWSEPLTAAASRPSGGEYDVALQDHEVSRNSEGRSSLASSAVLTSGQRPITDREYTLVIFPHSVLRHQHDLAAHQPQWMWS
jgi:hypothetical protein